MEKSNGSETFRYCLIDFLEVHFSENREVILNVMRKLLDSQARRRSLCQLSCLAVGDRLVIVQDGHRQEIKRLYLLDARDESIQTYRIGPVSDAR